MYYSSPSYKTLWNTQFLGLSKCEMYKPDCSPGYQRSARRLSRTRALSGSKSVSDFRSVLQASGCFNNNNTAAAKASSVGCYSTAKNTGNKSCTNRSYLSRDDSSFTRSSANYIRDDTAAYNNDNLKDETCYNPLEISSGGGGGCYYRQVSWRSSSSAGSSPVYYKLDVVPERTEGDGGPASSTASSYPDSVNYNSYRRHRYERLTSFNWSLISSH